MNMIQRQLGLIPFIVRKEDKGEYIQSLVNSLENDHSTSIGANVAEAFFEQSDADFIAKLYISRKEAGETIYWIEPLKEALYISCDAYIQGNKGQLEDITKIKALIILFPFLLCAAGYIRLEPSHSASRLNHSERLLWIYGAESVAGHPQSACRRKPFLS